MATMIIELCTDYDTKQTLLDSRQKIQDEKTVTCMNEAGKRTRKVTIENVPMYMDNYAIIT